MSKLSKIFSDVPVDIPNRSGFDISHENLGTLKVGQLTPILCEPLSPNDTVDLGYLMRMEMPPLATNFFGRVDVRLEAFFVPNRIIWNGWKDFWTQPTASPYDSLPVRPLRTPGVQFPIQSPVLGSIDIGPGSLTDYLGRKIAVRTSTGLSVPTLLPYLAYHKIYDDWYRNTMIQKEVFPRANVSRVGVSKSPFQGNPWNDQPQSDFNPVLQVTTDNASQLLLADGVNVFDLRQRNYAKDYFTTAALYPDSANGSSLQFSVDSDSDTGSFTIGALRAANTLQKWLDRNNIAGFRYSDQIRSQFGILPSDAIMDRALFLGSSKFGLYSNSVTQSTPNDETGSGNEPDGQNTNPWRGILGSKGGQASGQNDDKLVNNFTASEHGYLMVLCSIVPHAYYASGTRRYLALSQPSDYPVPLLQGLGEQAIYDWELVNDSGSLSMNELGETDPGSGNEFGYTPQYSWAKYHEDEVHGQLRDDGDLSSFALKRSFDSGTQLSSEFIRISSGALDEVLAVPSRGNIFWYDCFFSFKKVTPLQEYVIPTLGDLKNTHKETIPFRGRQL